MSKHIFASFTLLSLFITIPVAAESPAFSRDLELGDTGEDVRELQVFLNKSGFSVAPSGPGSPGNETTIFGYATKAAVKNRQTSAGLPATGYFGPMTRNYIASRESIASSGVVPSSQTATLSSLGLSESSYRTLKAELFNEFKAMLTKQSDATMNSVSKSTNEVSSSLSNLSGLTSGALNSLSASTTDALNLLSASTTNALNTLQSGITSSQWVSGENGSISYNGGNVSIGTTLLPVPDGLSIVQRATTDTHSGISLMDDATNSGRLLEIQHFGAGAGGGGQAYGLDLHNYPGAKTAFVIHNYSDAGPVAQWDNTTNAAMLVLKNTDNQTLSPGTFGTGNYFSLYGFDAEPAPGGAVLLGTLDSALAFRPATVNRFWAFVSNLATPALKVTQSGAYHGLVVAHSGGNWNPIYVTTTSGIGSYLSASGNDGYVLKLEKLGTGAGDTLLVKNKGTGNGITVTDASNATKFAVDKDGAVTSAALAGSGNAFACLDANGKLYRSATACN